MRYLLAARSPGRPRGKWHLLPYALAALTICDERIAGWTIVDRKSIEERDVCTRCLRQTP